MPLLFLTQSSEIVKNDREAQVLRGSVIWEWKERIVLSMRHRCLSWNARLKCGLILCKYGVCGIDQTYSLNTISSCVHGSRQHIRCARVISCIGVLEQSAGTCHSPEDTEFNQLAGWGGSGSRELGKIIKSLLKAFSLLSHLSYLRSRVSRALNHFFLKIKPRHLSRARV